MKYRPKGIALLVITLCFSGLLTSTALSTTETDTLVHQEAERGGYRLIDVDTLWQRYQSQDDNILLIDTRQDWEYRSGYIKDAIHFSMEPTWFSRLIQRDALAQALGPDKGRILIFY